VRFSAPGRGLVFFEAGLPKTPSIPPAIGRVRFSAPGRGLVR